MDLPDIERVKYDNNPLIEVLFQIRIPQLLEIAEQLPIKFQKAVRDDFPLLENRLEILQPTVNLTNDQAQQPEIPIQKVAIYDFLSLDKKLKLSICKDFISLSTQRYEGWEDFKFQAEKCIEAFLNIYEPKYFTRIGLRYQNIIQREKLGLKDAKFSELLSPDVAGILGQLTSKKEEKDILKNIQSQVLFKKDNMNVNLRHGLAVNKDTNETGYLIDADYSSDENRKATLDEAITQLEQFHSYSWKLFRWCISDKLHQSMSPSPRDTSRK